MELHELNQNLIQAVLEENIQTVESLLSRGANINARDTEGQTPLIHAICKEKTSLVKLLLNRGADVEIEDEDGWTAIKYAEQLGNTQILSLLQNGGNSDSELVHDNINENQASVNEEKSKNTQVQSSTTLQTDLVTNPPFDSLHAKDSSTISSQNSQESSFLGDWRNIIILCTVIGGSILIGILLLLNGNNSTSTANRSSSSPSTSTVTHNARNSERSSQSVNPFKDVEYPQSSCGDSLPKDSDAYPLKFYPVFLEKSERNLEILKTKFCRDAYFMYRKRKNKESIQVASFQTRERAELFREFLSNEIDTAEVGEPTVWEEMPESLQ